MAANSAGPLWKNVVRKTMVLPTTHERRPFGTRWGRENREKWDVGETRHAYFSALVTSELYFLVMTISISGACSWAYFGGLLRVSRLVFFPILMFKSKFIQIEYYLLTIGTYSICNAANAWVMFTTPAQCGQISKIVFLFPHDCPIPV